MYTHPGRYWTSYGCVQAVIIVTLAILTLLFPVYANDRTHVNLLMALNLTTNEGVTSYAPYAYSLRGGRPHLIIPKMDFKRALEALRLSNDITLLTTFQQEPNTTGSLISLSDNETVYLGLQSQLSGSRKHELRLKYVDGDGRQRTELFEMNQFEDRVHKVAVSISGTEVQVFYDCHSIYKRPMERLADRNFSASNMTLYVGQENLGSNYFFKGKLEEAIIVSGPNGYVLQCPHLDSHCPTCGQFRHLQDTIELLQQSLYDLKLRLEQTEIRLATMPSCECSKRCVVDGIAKVDGEIWDSPNNTCQICTCTNGVISCNKRPCPTLNCKNPAPPDESKGECCPYCLKKCLYRGVLYEHGAETVDGCFNWKCYDGNMNSSSTCDAPNCPESEQLQSAEKCKCKICKVDYCAKGHACHTNARCLNLTTKYTCTCRPGFHGDGFHCDDIDECAQKGGTNGNHCHSNTRCNNTSGSYICECLPGYRRVDKFNCVEINECDTGQHTCHENAICLNTQGSYSCRCKEGFSGDGISCEPVCKHRCLNGGECVAPDVCSCRVGFIGTACEKDLDECATGLHGCHNNSLCINMPGWYYCSCKPGYKSETHDGTECVDIDECRDNVHSCHATASCVNTPGHFECHCPSRSPEEEPVQEPEGDEQEESNCRLSCMYDAYEIPDGGQISPRNQPCKICTCDKGVISCREKPCNCSDGGQDGREEERDRCCPQCDPNQSCTHQELKHVQFKSGEQWIYRCQTCECLYGEYYCWKLECPPLSCDNPLPLQPGDCCARCDNDPCNFFGSPSVPLNANSSSSVPNATQSAVGHPCTYKGNSIASGQSFDDPSSRCTTCACKDGRLYCNFGRNCFGGDKLRLVGPATSAIRNGSSETDNDHPPSKAAPTAEKRPLSKDDSLRQTQIEGHAQKPELPLTSVVMGPDSAVKAAHLIKETEADNNARKKGFVASIAPPVTSSSATTLSHTTSPKDALPGTTISTSSAFNVNKTPMYRLRKGPRRPPG